MADRAGTLERLALALGRALETLAVSLGEDYVHDTFARLGVKFPKELLTEPNITPVRAALIGAADALGPARQTLKQAIASGDTAIIIAAGTTLLNNTTAVLKAAADLGQQLQLHGPSLPGIDGQQMTELVANLPRKLLEQVIVDILDNSSSTLPGFFSVTGLISRIHRPGDPANPTKPEFEEVTIRFDRLTTFLATPATQFQLLYGWGDPTFDGVALLSGIYDALVLMGFPAFVVPGDGSTPPRLRSLDFEIHPASGGLDVSTSEALTDHSESTFPILAPGWTVQIRMDWNSAAGTTAHLQPPLTITIMPQAAFKGEAQVALKAAPAEPIVLVGQAGRSRLEVAEIELDAGIEVAFDALTGKTSGKPVLQGKLTDGKLIIDTSTGDGFVSTVLAGTRLEAGFDVGFVFDPEHGLRFDGSGGLELQIPVHLDLGPVEVREIYLLAGLTGGKLPLELSAGFSASLGPIRASVERVGLLADLSFPDGGGNLGPVDLGFRFKPPNGVGLDVDTGIIAGGGYLYADPDRGEYAGALSLEFAGFVELNAIGLISTRMPDGSTGFSLLIVITAEFSGGGIQLGYGFTLLAVGGLIGLNRRVDLNALVEGVRTGSIESVMFPRDVIANAPRILSDLGRFFPPEQGTFLIGPMAKIGWGTPTLISVSVGVIVEIPPGTIVILGVLKCALPTRELPLLVLQISFVGAFEPDKSRLWFFAQLFDSHILTMTIDGGMGLLVMWGDNPDFVLTVGGFHPSFRPPPMPFPVPPRLSVDILNQPGRLIRVAGYFAVTSNTVQFGARAELRLGFSDFYIEGHLAFDALFRFSPFAFVIQISAGVSLKAFGVGLFGIDLRFQLEGPAPWRAHGRGSISLLFFEISADFDITWGEDRNPTLPPVEVLALLAGEITKVEGWETRLPTGGTRALVTLRALPETDDLVLHPLGTLFIRQRAIPLDVRIDRVGAQRPSDGTRFSVTPATDSGLVQVAITGDKFAMAQFQDMDDAAKLSGPAYENQDAGLELAAAHGKLASVRVVRRSARFEQIVIDSKRGAPTAARGTRLAGEVTRSAKRLVSVSPAVFDHLLNGSSTSRSPLSRQDAGRRQPFAPEDGLRIDDQRYVVAYMRNNVQAFPPSTRADRRGTSTFRSRTTAADALADWVSDEPSLAGTLHVIPLAEMAGELAVPGAFTPAGPLPTAVSGAEPIRLANGKVLLAGGVGTDGKATKATSLFDPVANTWAPTNPLSTERRAHSTTLLADGRVLVAGGLDANGTALGSAEIYDPIAATWTAVPAPMATARFGHSATALRGGQVLVAGGTGKRGDRDSAALSTAELFTPAEGTWSKAKPMTDARTGHRAVRLADDAVAAKDTVLVIGGELTTGGRGAALAGCETYDPATDTWIPTTGELGIPRTGHQATLLADGSVLVTGGYPVAPRLEFPRHNDPPFRPDGLAAAERYDPKARTWRPVADLHGGRTAAPAVLLRSGRVLVIGGTGGPARDTGYRSVVSHNPGDGTWSTAGSLGTGRWDFAAVELADGRVLVTGGRTRTATIATTEIFNP